MSSSAHKGWWQAFVVAAVAIAVPSPVVSAHLTVLAPNGGETFTVGDEVTISWQVAIAHNTQDWDVWYSTTGGGGPWIALTTNLPPGNTPVGSINTHDWTIPAAAVSNQVRVRVRMDNVTGTDYYDISNTNITVNPPIWVDLGFSLPGTHGAPLFVGESSLVGGDTISLTLSNALENTTANLVVGFAELNFSPFFGGTLVPDIGPPGFFIPLPTDGTGSFQIVETWPTGVPPGFTLYLQYWIDDAAGPFGISASNAISGTVP